ncbi:MAG: dimethyl sulfoxide reductase anchor subunit, partial [Eggerthellaceae bacterium]|nr:dimethyl sulfoxide reductase anchor subunit [Eggerthellaceae bacterium]
MEIQWSLLLFSALAGAGGSLLAFTGIAELMGKAPKAKKQMLAIVLVLVIAGGLFSVLHLEQKANIMAAAANVFSFSAISMELIFVGLVAVMAIIYLVCAAREVSGGAVKAVAVISIVVGLLLGYVTGSGYQM